jgi:predicted RNA-binding protein with PIN domain
VPLVRQRRPRRGGDRLNGSGVDPDLVRTALERAVEVAREGEEATPATAAPKELQPFLHFRQLTGPARAAVLRLLETDDEFRRRVREATAPDALDAAGWLLLERPPGWEDLLARVDAAGPSVEADRRLRDLQRRLEGAEHKLQHAEEEVARRTAEATAARSELDEVRRAKRRAEEGVAEAAQMIEGLKEKLGDRDRRLADAQGAREAREHELAEARRQAEDLQSELDRRPPEPVAGERPVDVAALRAVAAELDRAALGLARAVAAVAQEVPDSPPAPPDPVPEAPARRHATRLPGGVLEDSAAGGRWLLARPAVVAVVDGYNVSKGAWPDQGLPEQRRRLVKGLDELATRTGATVEVVFDGPADADGGSGLGTRSVGVHFSGGVEADGVVVGMINSYPVDRPVVVVSSDNEVKTGARRHGANVLSARTLLAVLKGGSGA